jgi:spore maturation protein CgeB
MSRDVKKLVEQMRCDWDRRVKHDYLFWMSEANADLQKMWEAGERDVALLFEDIELPPRAVGLELGCGVGRLLKAARLRLGSVVGIDVSPEAIKKAQDFLSNFPNIECQIGNGANFQPLPAQSFDLVFSFAAFSSIPTQIAAEYLKDAARVLRPHGVIRFQCYIGAEQGVRPTDTLHLRCYPEDGLRDALDASGFIVEWIRPLKLPFQVSFEELSIYAVIVSARRKASFESVDSSEIEKKLLPSGVESESNSQTITDLEAFMTARHADELYAKGDFQRARRAAEYAMQVSQSATIDTRDILEKISNRDGTNKSNEKLETLEQEKKDNNHNDVISSSRDESLVTTAVTDDGPVILYNGVHLDHSTSPRLSAISWVERNLPTDCSKGTPIVIFGLGAGYHLAPIIERGLGPIIVVEPSMDVVLKASRLGLDFQFREKGVTVIADTDVKKLDAELSKYKESPILLTRPVSYALFVDFHELVKVAVHKRRITTGIMPKVAVLGPMMGGTLPLLPSVSRGIASNRQRVRSIDMQSFASGFQAIEGFTRDKVRCAISQNRFLEAVSGLVLDQYREKPFDILICLAQAPISLPTLLELRNAGVVTVLWFVEDYLRFTYWQQIAHAFDYIFTIQKGNAIQEIKKAGAGRVYYLPLACDPSVHMPLALSEEELLRWGSPVSFVGAGYYNRQQIFASLSSLPLKIWGTEWPDCRPFNSLIQEQGRRLAPEEYVKVFNATKVNLNLHSSKEKDGVDPRGDFVNPRTFELAAAGAFQLVDHRSLLPELFDIGKEIITFDSVNDLKEKISFYLSKPDERVTVATAARARALDEHSFMHRMNEMLAYIMAGHYDELKARTESSCWNVVLERSKKDTELHERCNIAFQRGEEPSLDALVSDIIVGEGKLSDTEQKLMFLHHIRKQTTHREHAGETAP